MKKTILLTLLIASFTGAQAAVSISGTALQNPVAISGLANPAGGDTAWFVDATDIGTWGASAAAFTSYVLGADYTNDQVFSNNAVSFFGSVSVGGANNVALDDTPFAIVVEVASDSSYSLYTDAAWVGPATGGTLSVSPTNGQAADYSVVPEPSTYALIAGFVAFLFVAIRRRK